MTDDAIVVARAVIEDDASRVSDYEDYAARVKRDEARVNAMRDDLIRRLDALKAKPSRAGKIVIHTTEVAIGAFVGGAVEGRTGVRIGLCAGIAGIALSFVGAGGGYSEHVSGIGEGMFASYLTSLGRAAATWRKADGK